MLSPIEIDRNLIIDKGVDFALGDFKRRRGFIFEEQNFGILEMLVRVNMTGGSLFNCNGRSWDVDISDGF